MAKNKKYYEFIFMGNQGKNVTLRITNAKSVNDVNQIKNDMDSIISMDILETSKGKPVAKRLVRYVEPNVVDIEVS